MASSSTLSFQVKDKIDLTEKETQIFERLLQVLRHFNLQTQLRVAGGWVRDKLLGKDCYDIDIALDDMLGREFCEKVNEYLSFAGEEKQGIGVIQCNPDQSKHLETARMRLFDVWIDFVNLRSENYSENSRIPTMEFGTAEQDAYRRDLTINSLFYNINTNSVEDFTGRGVTDLKSGKIVTPLPPEDTFLDDPLRVLRAIRFGARFEFVLDEKLKEAAASDKVKAAIADKISRERIGHEIDLMISGNQPVQAMTYICDLQLFWVVFCLPAKFEPAISEGCDRLVCVAFMDAASNLLQLIGCTTFNDEQRRLYLYATLFLPLREFIYVDNKAKKIPIVNYIFRNSLKLKASDAETVINLHIASERFTSLILSVAYNNHDKIVEVDEGIESLDVSVTLKQRIFAGLLLREIKGFWRVALLMSTLLYPIDFDLTEVSIDKHIELDKHRDLFSRVENTIIELGLENVWEKKPLVNGKEIMSILQLKTGGSQVGEWLQKLIKWQLASPSGTAEEFLDWMRETETHSKRAKLE
ncbi:Poly A polymerase [Macleaya cordata]|uniref:Poly A polymerase n=1 Tax=Macleaya cordata TaxID=56857 RepID=A0A200Q4C2_MACCD|nr:Poly A polymerase [Macleaya cordata]